MNSFHTIAGTRWFRSAPVAPDFEQSNIDAEAGIIRDVVMAQEGEAQGHGVHLEGEFISNLVAYDRANFSRIGLKSRFGHPSASSETMGTQLGIYSNFRKREKGGKMQAIADLHLLESADLSPTHPGTRAWVLSMAAERPDFIMSSIVFRGSGFYQRKPNGNKHRLEPNPDAWWDGNEWLNFKEDWGDIYIEFDANAGAKHFYTDLVEAGAATDNLFGTQANPDFFVSKAHQFLDDNPEIIDFVKNNPSRAQAFLTRLGISIPQPHKKMAKPTSIWEFLTGKSQDRPDDVSDTDLDALKTQLAEASTATIALQAERDALQNRVDEFTTQVDALQANVAALKTEVEQLRADVAAKAAEIEQLKKEPADKITGGETNDEPAKPKTKKFDWDTDKERQRLRKGLVA